MYLEMSDIASLTTIKNPLILSLYHNEFEIYAFRYFHGYKKERLRMYLGEIKKLKLIVLVEKGSVKEQNKLKY